MWALIISLSGNPSESTKSSPLSEGWDSWPHCFRHPPQEVLTRSGLPSRSVEAYSKHRIPVQKPVCTCHSFIRPFLIIPLNSALPKWRCSTICLFKLPLAKLSTCSFPWIPACPGTQQNEMSLSSLTLIITLRILFTISGRAWVVYAGYTSLKMIKSPAE